MDAKALTPILNVSDMAASFDWFVRLGWTKNWEWGEPPTFGAVGSGECEIFLSLGAQGSRGYGGGPTFGEGGSTTADRGVWMSVFVGDVDAIHRRCLEYGLDVAFPPTDMPWGMRELHVRHPDGHVLRISQSLYYTYHGAEGHDHP